MEAATAERRAAVQALWLQRSEDRGPAAVKALTRQLLPAVEAACAAVLARLYPSAQALTRTDT